MTADICLHWNLSHKPRRGHRGIRKQRASEPRERATRTEGAGAAASERVCRGVRGAKPLG